MLSISSFPKKKALAVLSLATGVIMIAASLTGTAGAATQSDSVTVNANVQLSGSLTLVSWDLDGTQHDSGPFTANFGSIIPNTTYENSSTAGQAVQATAATNSSSWSVTQYVSANQLVNGGNSINLQWRMDGSGSYNAAMGESGSPDSIGSGAAPTAGTTYEMDYAVNASWLKPTGNYSGTVTYTLSYT